MEANKLVFTPHEEGGYEAFLAINVAIRVQFFHSRWIWMVQTRVNNQQFEVPEDAKAQAKKAYAEFIAGLIEDCNFLPYATLNQINQELKRRGYLAIEVGATMDDSKLSLAFADSHDLHNELIKRGQLGAEHPDMKRLREALGSSNALNQAKEVITEWLNGNAEKALKWLHDMTYRHFGDNHINEPEAPIIDDDQDCSWATIPICGSKGKPSLEDEEKAALLRLMWHRISLDDLKAAVK